MAARARLLSLVATASAVVAVGSPTGEGANRAAVLPTLYVAYAMNCTFSITDDSRRVVTLIAPGTYQVMVTSPVVFSIIDLSGTYDMTACKGSAQFVLTGSGVDLATTLQDGDEDKDILKATFQPSATYTARDLNQPTVARAVFTTTATGSPTSPSGPSSGGSSTVSGTASTDVVGSKTVTTAAAAPILATLTATVGASGQTTFTKAGKPVTALAPGRYRIALSDRDQRSGFAIQMVGRAATILTGDLYVGTRTTTVVLKAGQWRFSSARGKTSSFVVSG